MELKETFGLEFIGLIKKNAERMKYFDKHRLVQFLEMENIIPEFHKIENVKLCENCEGTGIYHWDELADYHKGEYNTFSKTCEECNGSGRILHIEYSASKKEPYVSKVK